VNTTELAIAAKDYFIQTALSIEGNTGPEATVERNGDGVYRKHRRLIFEGKLGSMVVGLTPSLVEADGSQG
jgi:hypothetical protein